MPSWDKASTSFAYRSDPELARIRPVPPLEVQPPSFMRYRPPDSYSRIPLCPRPTTWKRQAILVVLCLSISLGTTLAYVGAQAYDQVDTYLNDLRNQRNIDPFM
ncbi:unnamed protein product [Cylicocyclus nassatus]|uniref:Uncharacterized protein n=1 Tax=Cylicocyclus nassatus TaxID=53992 RepID=A0AA36GFJ8_CYLNA|nr:unnamed protein product [Cylicocyclus nassatus]